MSDNGKPRVGLTMGDPAGVGPELVLRAMTDPIVKEQCDLTVFGDAQVLERCAQKTGLEFPTVPQWPLAKLEESDAQPDGHLMIDLQNVELASFTPCRVSSACGRASFEYIHAAIDACLRHQLAAVTTAPINKEALREAGIHYPGHTEIFAERAESQRWCMMQYSREITCTFVTVHIGYADVPRHVTTQNVLATIELTNEALLKIQKKQPHIVVCGLNPHAGEHGLFGYQEEERFIIPAIEKARAMGLSVEGPVPPDTAFLPWKREKTDAFVCMYHDQGHIPVKALAFDSAVNTTLGINMIRTSVDHGTAFDIAWKGVAKASSLYSAICLAVQLSSEN